MLTAAAAYEDKLPGKKVEPTKPGQQANAPAITGIHASFNPIVRLEWPTPDKMYLETAFIRLFNEPVNTWSRWHLVTFSHQAVLLKK